jgi:hypothetical protein
MLAVTDRRKIGRAVILMLVGSVLLALSWTVRNEPSATDCAQRHNTNEAVLDCVTEEAGDRSASASAWILTAVGVGVVLGGIFMARGSVERVMSMHDVAIQLGVPVAEARRLVDEGRLQPVADGPEGVKVRADDVALLART